MADLHTLGPVNVPTDDQYRTAARAEYACEGDVAIDDNAIVSRGDEKGAYVAAWVWVAEPLKGAK